MKYTLSLIALSLLPFVMGGTRPTDGEAKITATNVTTDGTIRHFRGDVRVETPQAILRADELDWDTHSGQGDARGNVKFTLRRAVTPKR